MSLILRGRRYHYDFIINKRRYQGSTKTADRSQAELIEQREKDRILAKPRGYKWHGSVSYASYHKRVGRKRGKPKHCEHCGTTDPEKQYDWASLTRNYADINDYIRLCHACHLRQDIGKLKKADFAIIRQRRAAGESLVAIAKSFHVTPSVIGQIVRGNPVSSEVAS